MPSRTVASALALLGIGALAAPVAASHDDDDALPATPYIDYVERVTPWVAIWHEDPGAELLQGPAGFAASALADELGHITPERCYLRSYGAFWGLVPTLDAVRTASDQAAFDRARGRARDELALAFTLADEDARRCAEAVAEATAGPREALATPTPPLESTVELEAAASLQFLGQDGERVSTISVVPGETMLIRVDNTAGFEHSFYIGTEEELSEPEATTEVGIETWTAGARELVWTVPDDPSGLLFGCTVPGHVSIMHGQLVVASD